MHTSTAVYHEARRLGHFRTYWGFWLVSAVVGFFAQAMLGPPPGAGSLAARAAGAAIMGVLIIVASRLTVMRVRITHTALEIDSTGTATASIPLSDIKRIEPEAKTVGPQRVIAPLGFSRPWLRGGKGVSLTTKGETAYVFTSRNRPGLISAVQEAMPK